MRFDPIAERQRRGQRTERSGLNKPPIHRPYNRPGQTNQHGKHRAPAHKQAFPPAWRDQAAR